MSWIQEFFNLTHHGWVKKKSQSNSTYHKGPTQHNPHGLGWTFKKKKKRRRRDKCKKSKFNRFSTQITTNLLIKLEHSTKLTQTI